MANYRQIHTQIWRDNWFLDLEADEKLLFIYLFSNDNSNLAGLYELHEKIIVLETGLARERIHEIIAKFEADKKVLYKDGIVWIVNMQRYHSNAGEKVRRNIELIVEGIPDCYVKQQYCIANGIEPEDTPTIEYAYSMDTLSYSKSNSKSNSKSKNEEEPEAETTTAPDSEIFKFGYVFQEITGIDPRWDADEVDAVEKIIKAGGTPDDYRNALLAMQEKDYTIGSMKSALNWTLKDLKARTNPKRRNNGGHKSLSPELDEILKDAPIFAEDYPMRRITRNEHT